MKVRIDRQSAAKAITEHEVSEMARRIQQNIINESARRYDMILAYVLHEEFGSAKNALCVSWDAYAKKKGINV